MFKSAKRYSIIESDFNSRDIITAFEIKDGVYTNLTPGKMIFGIHFLLVQQTTYLLQMKVGNIIEFCRVLKRKIML